MLTYVDDNNRVVEFWLTNEEKNDAALRASLKPQFAQWKAKNYLPVVYESGAGDLTDSIKHLVLHNRDVMAK